MVANKADNYEQHYNGPMKFYSFGLGDPICISAVNGSGTGDLLDEIVKNLPESSTEEESLIALV